MSRQPYPFKWVPISEEEKRERGKVFGEGSVEIDVARSEPGGFQMPAKFAASGMDEDIYNFEPRSTDVWVVTYPKCGTTVTQEAVWQITHDMDTEAFATTEMFERSPFLEISTVINTVNDSMPLRLRDSVGFTRDLEDPRVIKSHLPFEHLPPKLLDTCKVVYVCRNPKDVVVSYYHHLRTLTDMARMREEATFEQYSELFKPGKICYGDYWYHLKSAWKRRDHPNLKFIWYEELIHNQTKTLESLAEFVLGRPMGDETIKELQDHIKIDNMRKKAAERSTDDKQKKQKEKFYRKGQVGDWKNHFKDERASEWDEWIEENLKGTGIKEDFEAKTGVPFC